MWNGTAAILNARPAITKDQPEQLRLVLISPDPDAARTVAKSVPAGEAIEQAHAIEQNARSQRTKHEST